MQSIFEALKDTPQYYFEIKLFYLRQALPQLNVEKLDQVLKIFEVIFKYPPQKHPLVNCYNPIKCSLLVCEICYNIKLKNIFSLQR